MHLIPAPHPAQRFRPATLSLACSVSLLLGLAGCGGGNFDEPSASNSEAPAAAEVALASDTAERQTIQAVVDPRAEAAKATANSSANACAAIRPFYWEVGNGDGRTAGGAVLNNRLRTFYGPVTAVPLASASKWLYAAYVVEKNAGVLSAQDIDMLSMRSGYTSFDECPVGSTVQGCLNSGNNGRYTPENDHSFFYNGGHMQKHAVLNGLGSASTTALATAVRGQIGKEIAIHYARAQPAGGAVATPDAYARFLRKLLKGELRLGTMLGSHAACTSPSLCAPGEATFSPVEALGNVHYSLGHWVEDDASGDGAFSSSGALGFYPWIDAGRTTYGIVSRNQAEGGPASRACGRLIRKAWASGRAQ